MEEEQISNESKKELREKQIELTKLINALNKLDKSEEWSVLKEIVFDRSLKSIERQILIESLNKVINTNKLYKLQGEWTWAKQYADINRFAESLKNQLQKINNLLK